MAIELEVAVKKEDARDDAPRVWPDYLQRPRVNVVKLGTAELRKRLPAQLLC